MFFYWIVLSFGYWICGYVSVVIYICLYISIERDFSSSKVRIRIVFVLFVFIFKKERLLGSGIFVI